jgi:hypothetical protein
MAYESVGKKIKQLEDINGQTAEEMAEESVFDGTCASICMNEGCEETFEYEPDQDEGWCDSCETNSVQSILILLGII